MHPVPATSVWAVRLRAAASDIEDVSRALCRAGHDVGLRGSAGSALQHLVDGVAGEVRALAAACEQAAAAELAGERGA